MGRQIVKTAPVTCVVNQMTRLAIDDGAVLGRENGDDLITTTLPDAIAVTQIVVDTDGRAASE